MTNTLEHDIIRLQEINDYMGSEEFKAAIKAKTEEVFPAEMLQGITENLKAEIENTFCDTKRNQEIENMPFKYFYDTDSEQALTVDQVYDSYIPLAGVEYDSFEDFCDCITGMGSQCKGFCTLEELKAFVLEYTCEDVKWFSEQ